MKLRQVSSTDTAKVVDAEHAVVCSGRALPALEVSPVAVAPVPSDRTSPGWLGRLHDRVPVVLSPEVWPEC
jgi:hypothetical protein